MKQLCAFLLLTLLVLAAAPGFAGQKKEGREAGRNTDGVASSMMPKTSATVILSEGFEGVDFPPAGWSMLNNDHNVPDLAQTTPDDTAWYQSGSVGGTYALPPYEGSACAAAYYGAANDYYLDDWLITPNTSAPLDETAKDSLTFWAASRLSSSGEYYDSLDIRVSFTGTAAADFTIRLGYFQVPKPAWTRFAFPLPQGAARYIAFRYLMYDGGPNGANSDKVCVDAVQVTRTAPTGVQQTDNGVPAEFRLDQNFPNPFNPGSTIQFQIARESPVTLTVYNTLGEQVGTLVNEILAPGRYTARFDGSRLASGVYIYRLAAGSFLQTKQMILLK
jgi:hypothetical protein